MHHLIALVLPLIASVAAGGVPLGYSGYGAGLGGAVLGPVTLGIAPPLSLVSPYAYNYAQPLLRPVVSAAVYGPTTFTSQSTLIAHPPSYGYKSVGYRGIGGLGWGR